MSAYEEERNKLIRYAVHRANSEPGLDADEWNAVYLAAMTHLAMEAAYPVAP